MVISECVCDKCFISVLKCVIMMLYVCYKCVISVVYVCYTCVMRVVYVCYKWL